MLSEKPHCYKWFVFLIRDSCILSCQHVKVLLTSPQKKAPYGRPTPFNVTDSLHNSIKRILRALDPNWLQESMFSMSYNDQKIYVCFFFLKKGQSLKAGDIF